MGIWDAHLRNVEQVNAAKSRGLLQAKQEYLDQRGGMNILGTPARSAVAPSLMENNRMYTQLGGMDAREGTGYLGGELNREQSMLGLLNEGYSNQEVTDVFGSYGDANTQSLLRGGLKPNEYATQLRGLSKDRTAAVSPFRQASLGYKQVGNLLNEYGGIQNLDQMPGTFDLALQRNYIKALSTLRPEAYMQDDAVQSFMAANELNGANELWAFLKNATIGDIKLSNTGREQMLKSYNSVMKDNFEARDVVDAPFMNQASTLFPDTDRNVIFGDPISQYNPDLMNVDDEPYNSKPIISPEFTPDPNSNLTSQQQQRRAELRKMAEDEKNTGKRQTKRGIR